MSRHQQFHYARAEAELEAAQRATCAEAVKLHCELADLHFARMREIEGEGEWDARAKQVGHA